MSFNAATAMTAGLLMKRLCAVQFRPSSEHDSQHFTTNTGMPVWNNISSMTVGQRGPVLLEGVIPFITFLTVSASAVFAANCKRLQFAFLVLLMIAIILRFDLQTIIWWRRLPTLIVSAFLSVWCMRVEHPPKDSSR
jgi:hypothetical protein